MFRRISITAELLKEKEKILQDELLLEYYIVLYEEKEKDKKLQERITGNHSAEDTVTLSNLKSQNIFSIKEIRNICMRYRLRFLETRHLRYPLPYEAFIKIKEFEKQHQTEIKKFSIVAPAEAFRLDKKTDPLLFAHLGNDRYYLLHQWGNDLSWYRKMIVFPLRNLYTFLATVVLFSFALAFFIPKQWLVYDESLYPLIYNFRLFLFFLLSTGIFASLFYYGLVRNKQLNEDEWNEKKV